MLARIVAAAYIGDAPADMQAAATGVAEVAVPTGSLPAGDLRAAGADVLPTSPREFPG